MTLIHNNSLPFTLHLLRAHLQCTNKTDLLLPLRLDGNDLSRLERMLRIRETAARGSQTGSHQGGAGEDEADCAAVDLNRWEGGGKGVN